MLKTINVPDEKDILYVTFKNTLVHSPFFVLLDHEKKTIVYSIRGTISLDDCVKDVVAEEMVLDDVGKEWGFDGVGEYCHKGMFDTTMTMINTLKKRKLLPCLIQELCEFVRLCLISTERLHRSHPRRRA